MLSEWAGVRRDMECESGRPFGRGFWRVGRARWLTVVIVIRRRQRVLDHFYIKDVVKSLVIMRFVPVTVKRQPQEPARNVSESQSPVSHLTRLCFADPRRNVGRYRCLPARAASDAGSSSPRCVSADDCPHGNVCAQATIEASSM